MNNVLQNWNPFIPTKRDLERTDELAKKDPIITGVLSYLFLPAGLIYLNRAINPLKIFGYTIFLLIFVSTVFRSQENEDNSNSLANLITFIGVSGWTAEQVITVNKARQRQKGNSFTPSVNNFDKQESVSSYSKVDDQAIASLKELKRQFEANEITEEEFKIEKQKILGSL
jgi:hypothetical protein